MRSELGSGNFGVFQGTDIIHRQLRICAFFDTHAAADQHRHFQLHLLLQFAISLGEYQHLHRARHVFERALRVEIAALGFEHAKVGNDAGSGDVLVLARGLGQRADFFGAQSAQVFQLVAIFLQRMSADEKPRISFSLASRGVFIPVRRIRQLVVATLKLLPAGRRRTGHAGHFRHHAGFSARLRWRGRERP